MPADNKPTEISRIKQKRDLNSPSIWSANIHIYIYMLQYYACGYLRAVWKQCRDSYEDITHKQHVRLGVKTFSYQAVTSENDIIKEFKMFLIREIASVINLCLKETYEIILIFLKLEKWSDLWLPF